MPNRIIENTQLTAGYFLRLSQAEADEIIGGMSDTDVAAAMQWPFWCRTDQCEPDGNWRVWLVMAGRGFGKTRMGAEWVNERAMAEPGARIALIGANIAETRNVMVEGESGLLSLHGGGEIDWQPSLRRLVWPNGAQAALYSAAEPESLRGPQHHYAWADEIAKWAGGVAVWNNLRLGLRLGASPQIMATTTPRPIKLIRQLLAEEGCKVTRGSTEANAANLAPDFISAIRALYAGTRLGRQEIDGELIEEIQGALWTREQIEEARVSELPDMARIVIAVDPPVSAHGDECGIIAAGLGKDKKAYMLADHSVGGCSPEGWARAVAAAAESWQADRIIAEANQGGAMVESTLRAADIAMPVKLVHASRGKVARAEPVAALYEAGRAFHCGAFPQLEDQLCGLIAGGAYEGPGRSPDRADALVWAMTELMLGKSGVRPRVRVL